MCPVQECWVWSIACSAAVGRGRWLGCCGGLFEIGSSGECLCDVIFEFLGLSESSCNGCLRSLSLRNSLGSSCGWHLESAATRLRRDNIFVLFERENVRSVACRHENRIMYLLKVVGCGLVLINVVCTEYKAMIDFDPDEVMRCFVKGLSRTGFSCKSKVELVEEIWMFMMSVRNDDEKHERLDRTDEILMNSLLDVNDDQSVEMSKVSLELKSRHD